MWVPNYALKLSRPGFGSGLKPLTSSSMWPAARRPTFLSRRCPRRERGGRRDRAGFGTWALAAQLSGWAVRPSQTHATSENETLKIVEQVLVVHACFR